MPRVYSVIVHGTIREGMNMNPFSVPVDATLLASLPPGTQDELVKDIEEYFGEGSCAGCYIRVCPYCAVLSAFLLPGMATDGATPLLVCTRCGGSTPFEKCRETIRKAKAMREILEHSTADAGKRTDDEMSRVMLEQCTALLASGVRLFLSELYGICMDVTYVKPEFSLYGKLTDSTDYKGVFLESVVDRFKTGLKMDIAALLGADRMKHLNLMQLKHGVLVFNNGRADPVFLKLGGIQARTGSRIPLLTAEVAEYIRTVEDVVDVLEKECGDPIAAGTRERIKARLTRSLADLTYESPGTYVSGFVK